MSDAKCEMRDEIPGAEIAVMKEWHVAQAQRAAKTLARSVGLSQVVVFSFATSVSELANNLFFHTRGGGTITLRAVRQNGSVGVEVVAEDDGPGIANVDLVMQDGFTTNGGLGGGLPGVERLMDEFEIESQVGAGTRVVARKWEQCS